MHAISITPTQYSFAMSRPLCVFQVLYKGAPIVNQFDGKTLEHGSHMAAEDHARRLAAEHLTSRANFAVRRVWL